MSLLAELGGCIDIAVLGMSCYGRCYYTDVHKLFSSLYSACDCCCCASWRSTAAYDCSGAVNFEKNVLSENPLWAHCILLCSSPFAWLQPRYDAEWKFSPSNRVQLKQFGVDSVFLFRAFPMQVATTSPQTSRGLLPAGPYMAKVLAVVVLREASLRSILLYLANNMVKALWLEYFLRLYVSG
jgi:hypothetical protein